MFSHLSEDEQKLFVTLLPGYVILDHAVVKSLQAIVERFDRRGKIRTGERKKLIATLRDEKGLTATEIHRNYEPELVAINGGPVSLDTVKKDYSWRPEKKPKKRPKQK